ncbi:GNAT family N-acetyltransferase [Alkalihalobacillus sp. AL-G]|uniref:GNAT family N-acetyltransferase n=1 Tax=Alkalihalobacillus sp. AL-G TaxID=2926399 RepID=UPI00272D4C1E|nr:GNAT family N-acetyltransferase [Alkalihalobacillus sp. AL-G]WLD93118.1 GNAT family N-acetyltransferase [Alkalihalobacillus sp. AL-G]
MNDFRWKYVYGVMWDHEEIPDNVEVVERPEVLMYKTEGSTSLFSNKVARVDVDSEQKLAEVLKEIEVFFGSKPFSWWIGPDSSPGGLAGIVENHGYQHHDTYFGLVKSVEMMDDNLVPYKIRVAESEQDVRAFVDVSASIWNYDEATRETIVQQRIAYLRSEGCRGGVLVVSDGDRPIAYAGYRFSSDGEAMYLSGTGVLGEYRGQGIYRALLKKRVELAREHGCKWIATQARTGTSEPILRRSGFEEIGVYKVFTVQEQ